MAIALRCGSSVEIEAVNCRKGGKASGQSQLAQAVNHGKGGAYPARRLWRLRGAGSRSPKGRRRLSGAAVMAVSAWQSSEERAARASGQSTQSQLAQAVNHGKGGGQVPKSQ